MRMHATLKQVAQAACEPSAEAHGHDGQLLRECGKLSILESCLANNGTSCPLPQAQHEHSMHYMLFVALRSASDLLCGDRNDVQ